MSALAIVEVFGFFNLHAMNYIPYIAIIFTLSVAIIPTCASTRRPSERVTVNYSSGLPVPEEFADQNAGDFDTISCE